MNNYDAIILTTIHFIINIIINTIKFISGLDFAFKLFENNNARPFKGIICYLLLYMYLSPNQWDFFVKICMYVFVSDFLITFIEKIINYLFIIL